MVPADASERGQDPLQVPSEPVDRQRFRRRQRLLTRGDFDRVFRQRRRAGDARLTVHVADNVIGHARLGISTSRRLGNAVKRNLARRRLREAFRLHQQALPPLDIVCVVRQHDASVVDFGESLLRLTRSARRERRSKGQSAGR